VGLKAKKIEGVKGVYFRDYYDAFGDVITKKDFPKIKPPFELMIRVYVENRQLRLYLPFKNRTIRAAITEALAEIERIKIEGTTVSHSRLTFRDLFDDYMKNGKISARSDSHRYAVGKVLEKWLPDIWKIKISRIGTKHVQKGIDDCLRDGRSPRTAESIQQYIRPVFNYAIEKGYLERNPAEHLVVPKYDNQRYFELDETSAKRLFKAILEYPIQPYRDIFVWLLHGRRLNEVLSLRWKHLNIDGGWYEIAAETNKARRNMRYPLTELLVDAIPEPGCVDDLVFPSQRTGGKIDRVSLRRNHWRRVLDKAKIVDMRLHDLRHLYGFIAVNYLNLPLETIAATLGHSSIEVTRRYSNTKMKTIETATDKFLAFLSK